MRIIINGIIAYPRDKLILQNNLKGDTVLSYVCRCVKAAFPAGEILGITNDETVAAQFDPEGVRVRRLDPDCAEAAEGNIEPFLSCLKTNRWVLPNPDDRLLILSPALGGITPERIERICAAVGRAPDTIVVSCGMLHHNANPSWLYCANGFHYELGFVGGPVDLTKILHAFHFMSQEDIARFLKVGIEYYPSRFGDRQTTSVRANLVSGSQWLPEIYHADAAVMCGSEKRLCSGFGPDDKAVHLEPVDFNGTDTPVYIYRMPVFQMVR